MSPLLIVDWGARDAPPLAPRTPLKLGKDAATFGNDVVCSDVVSVGMNGATCVLAGL